MRMVKTQKKAYKQDAGSFLTCDEELKGAGGAQLTKNPLE